MSIRDQYDSKTPKQRKTIRIIGVFLALVLIAVIAHACSGPAQAQTYNSLLNPVYACKVVQPDGKVMLNILLPGRPEPGDTFSVFGGVREADGVSVNWTGIVRVSSQQPDRIPCVVVLK